MRRNADPNHLTRLPDGRFCKRIRGQLHYFGRDKDAALRIWLSCKDDLIAGKSIHRPGPSRPAVVTVGYCANHFLTACTLRLDAGQLRGGTFADYKRAIDDFLGVTGKGRDPDDLQPADFAAVRAKWGERMGPWALDRHVQAVRTMFNHALAQRLIEREPFYARSFSKSTEADKRQTAKAAKKERGTERIFTAAEVRSLLGKASGQLKAMILLAINGGMYAADIARLTLSDIQRGSDEWLIDFDRRKTGGVPWVFPLWPQTRDALKTVLEDREKRRLKWTEKGRAFPADAAHKDVVFLTLFAQPWHRESVTRKGQKIEGSAESNAIGQEFDRLLGQAKRQGVGFGAFRHTHVTAVGGHADERAAKMVRGHRVSSIEKHYDKVPIERLRAVTDLVRRKLLGK